MDTTAMPLTDFIVIDTIPEDGSREISAQFGDGYMQVAPNGLNNTFETIAVVWGPITIDQRNTLKSVLNPLGSWGIIAWKPPHDNVVKYYRKVKGSTIKYQPLSGSTYQVTMSLTQVFDYT